MRNLYIHLYTVALSVFLVGVMFIFTSQAHSEDPCAAFLCMAGKAQGSPSGGCQMPEESFYNIRIYTASGFNHHLTAEARRRYLLSCHGVGINQAILDEIIEKFGYDYD
ncbi:hypothetical protein [Entomobacter blattae]|uniref:Conjugal transfer protein n=1 Tax=Entomobacter blattae TaxID=2762277 RepID=A0A7H1NRR1_9PROT|nr:hypothetical protein [Entomobacter blattae]QNT77553.1 hypothetical protein JGUZn3_02960 [Entomobacter blattae]QNT78471.1 hypothetical protein JGUZn3_12450 [Entomobacter blattae]